jgi:hypothetical protein
LDAYRWFGVHIPHRMNILPSLAAQLGEAGGAGRRRGLGSYSSQY